MRCELGHLNAVDSRPRFSYRLDFVFAHLADPKDAVTLQAGGSQVDRAVGERAVEIAAFYQDEVNEIARELQQQPFGRVELPVTEPVVEKPRTSKYPAQR